MTTEQTNTTAEQNPPNITDTDSIESTQFLTFMVGEEYYGIDILKVREIRGWSNPTQIPNAPEYIRGVINLRGLIVPILDIRRRFRMDEIEFTAQTVVIVVNISGRTVGIVVDGVSDVVDIAAEEVRDAPDFGTSIDANFLEGLSSVNEHMVILLNADEILKSCELTKIDEIAESA